MSAVRLTKVLSLAAFVAIVVWGCAGLPPAPPPTPPREWVILETSSSTQYYSVRGTTTVAIFDEIERNGLFDDKARPAIGLTAAEWRIDWMGIESRPAVCSPEPMTITLSLVVTLPRHDQPSDLSQDITTSWQRFAARVAAHEQRHVDIFLDGAKKLRARIEAILTKTSSCSELETTMRGILASQKADTERTQDEFHLEDEAKIQADQKPLQAQIDINQTQLAHIDFEIRGLDEALDDLKRQGDERQAEIDAIKAQMAGSGASLPSCSQSRLTSVIQALCRQYNALALAHRTLVDEHNRAVARRNTLVGEHNRIVAGTNGLIEALNWTR